MAFLGKIHELKVLRTTSIGLFLEGGIYEDILLPNRYVPEDARVDDVLSVFIYLDNEGRPIATTLVPLAQAEQFAVLTVKQVNQYGAFLELGIMKDLFLPFSEQREKVTEGQRVLVYVYHDDISARLAATTRWMRILKESLYKPEVGEEVDLIVFQRTDLGFNCIINHKALGLMHFSDTITELSYGNKLKGYIKEIRPDDKINLSQTPSGLQRLEASESLILDKLKANNGFLPFTDDSDPDDIRNYFQISKKTFKRSVGMLLKKNCIKLEKEGIRLV
jgi:predicted RNA-binding protein (virulence factor B family)